MKKILIFLVFLLASLFSLSAQVTQEQADEIVIERMKGEASEFTIYAKDDVQTGFEIVTTKGEILELDYPCWVYFVNFTEPTNNKYLFVKENSGNILEMKTKHNSVPEDFEMWRVLAGDEYPIEIPFEGYSITATSCYWINLTYPTYPANGDLKVINSNEELENYITCSVGTYPEIDFSKHTLLVSSGFTTNMNMLSNIELLQNSFSEYTLNLLIQVTNFTVPSGWLYAFLMPKISDEATVILNVTYYKQ